MHKLLESVDFAHPRAPTTEQALLAARELGIRASKRECEEVASLVAAASASQAGPSARVAAAQHVRREHPFALALAPQEPLLTGVIDLLARERDGSFLVLDYKSDRVGGEEDLAELVAREYELQRRLYALAVLRDGAPAVEIVHWFLRRPDDWVSASFAAGDLGALEDDLRGRIQRAHAAGFAVSEHPHRGLCETCPGRLSLCSWSDAQTMRERRE